MPRKFELTWQAGTGSRQGRWKKKYKGRTLYLGSAGSKSDLEAYREALAVWQTTKAEIDAEEAARPQPLQEEYEAAIREWDQVLRWSFEHGDEVSATAARLRLAELRQRLADGRLPPLAPEDRFWNRFEWPRDLLSSITSGLPGTAPAADPAAHPHRPSVVDPSRLTSELDGSQSRIQREIWQDRLRVQSEPEAAADQSLGTNVERFLAGEQRRVDAGHLSAGRFNCKRVALHDFRNWLGQGTAISEIASSRLIDYRSDLLKRIGNGALAQDTAHDRLGDTLSFVRWLWETEAIPKLPRILAQKSSKLAIGKKLATPQFFTVDEVKECMKAANDRTRLYLLLMLNCGMYQGDISDLKHEEVDWRAGTVTRRRSKTRAHESVPTVRYRLWQDTLKLLRQHRTRTGERVLVNSNGNPLVVRGLKSDGRSQTNDSIKNAYDRLKKKTGITKPLKLLRKTSANLIRGSQEYRGLEELFLGHSPSSMSDRHYTVPPEELLGQAIAWVGQQYGVT